MEATNQHAEHAEKGNDDLVVPWPYNTSPLEGQQQRANQAQAQCRTDEVDLNEIVEIVRSQWRR